MWENGPLFNAELCNPSLCLGVWMPCIRRPITGPHPHRPLHIHCHTIITDQQGWSSQVKPILTHCFWGRIPVDFTVVSFFYTILWISFMILLEQGFKNKFCSRPKWEIDQCFHDPNRTPTTKIKNKNCVYGCILITHGPPLTCTGPTLVPNP